MFRTTSLNDEAWLMYDRKLVGMVNVTVYVPGGSTGGLHNSPLGQLD